MSESQNQNKPYDFMNDTFNHYLNKHINNLKIIQNIDYYDKLSVYDDTYYIDKYSYYQGIIRWFYDNNRLKSYNHIEHTFHILIDIYNDLTTQLSTFPKSNKRNIIKKKKKKINDYLTIIRNELDISITGLLNIQNTYKGDKEYCNYIKELITKINKITHVDKLL